MGDLSAGGLLALTGIAALIGVLGNVGTTIVKDFVFARANDAWRARLTAASIHRRLRDSLILTGTELFYRIREILDDEADHLEWLHHERLFKRKHGPPTNDHEDPDFLFYKGASTVYRLAAFLGWLELYRQEMTFIDVGHSGRNAEIRNTLFALSSILADGERNPHDDWEQWHDVLIYREEQRAIGERMLITTGAARAVMGYSAFLEAVDAQRDKHAHHQWVLPAEKFFADIGRVDVSRDFRIERLTQLASAILGLLVRLDQTRMEKMSLHAYVFPTTPALVSEQRSKVAARLAAPTSEAPTPGEDVRQS